MSAAPQLVGAARGLSRPHAPRHEPRASPGAGRGRVPLAAARRERGSCALLGAGADSSRARRSASSARGSTRSRSQSSSPRARARALSPTQILERLGDRLDATGRSRRRAAPADPPLDHRLVVRAPFGRRAGPLRPAVRVRGRLPLEAAESVVDADVETLQSLVEKSLLRWSGERYSMLETIREFAAEQLAPDEWEELLRRLTGIIVDLADRSLEALHAAEESVVSARLAPDYANVRTAVTHALEAGEPDDAATSSVGSTRFSSRTGSSRRRSTGSRRRWRTATVSRAPASPRRSSRAASSRALPATWGARSPSRRSSPPWPASPGAHAGARRRSVT